MARKPERRGPNILSPERATGKNALDQAVTASGYRIKRKEADQIRRLLQPWQPRAFAFYDILGEIKYASQFYSRALSKLRLYAAEIGDDGEVTETTNDDARAQLARIQDPGGGHSQLLSSYGRLMFLVGEAILFVSYDEDTEDEQWEFLSSDELRVNGDSYTRYRAPSLGAEEARDVGDKNWEAVDGKAMAYRIWRRHPRYSHLADSTMQGVLDICEELVLLTQVIRARARSRVAGNGILLLPDTVAPPPLDGGPDEDPLADPFIDDLVEAMTAPIADEGSASAVVPLIVRGQPDALDSVRHLQLVDPTQLYPETGLRQELINRLAIGLDLPPEVLLGLQDSNHWSAWQVDEQTWKAHLQPIAQYLVDDLTSAYYRPQLRELGIADWRKYCIAYDAAEIINHPDRTKDAKDLHDRAVLSDEALREASGFDDEDAPSEEEVNRRIGIMVRDSSLAVYGIPQVRGVGIEAQPGEVEDAAHPVSGEVVKSSPGGGGSEGAVPGDIVGSAAEVAKILGAADLTLRRAREKAGSRLLRLAKRDKDAAKLVAGGVPATKVAFTLGPEMAKKLRAPDTRELVAGAGDLLVEALAQWGIRDEKIAEFLRDQVERHAARTLFEENPPALPPALANYLLELQKG